MGNLIADSAELLVGQNFAIFLGIIVLIILGFIIFQSVKEDENIESNYEDDRRILNQNRGKVKGMI